MKTYSVDKKLYWRGRTAAVWYNFLEMVAYVLTYRPTPKGISYQKRILYGTERQQFFNLYRPENDKNKASLFVYIHGGGFISGITDMRNTYLQNFAKKGFVTASIAYTYAPKKVYPSQIQEVCSAMDALLDRADEYGFDRDRIVLSAESAGVYYMFLLASFAADKTLAKKMGVVFRHNEDFSVAAMVSHSGCIDLKKLLDPACPQSKFPDIKMMTCSFLGKRLTEARAFLKTEAGKLASALITDDFPPTFFAVGKKDPLRYESFDAIKVYEEKKIPFELFVGKGAYGAHAWTIATTFNQGKECLKKTLSFIEPYLTIREGE